MGELGCGQRIVVIGTSGTGKTTLAKQIAQRLHIPHTELDALHWEPNWTPAAIDVFRARAAEAVAGDCWVMDGNYSKVRDIVWSRADTIVWLDYPFWLVFRQIVWRTLVRGLRQTELWSGNRETLKMAFSQDSIIGWMMRTHGEKRRKYPLLLQQPEYQHLTVFRFQSPQATRQWLEGLG